MCNDVWYDIHTRISVKLRIRDANNSANIIVNITANSEQHTV